jgi:hypothetical protein
MANYLTSADIRKKEKHKEPVDPPFGSASAVVTSSKRGPLAAALFNSTFDGFVA